MRRIIPAIMSLSMVALMVTGHIPEGITLFVGWCLGMLTVVIADEYGD